MPAVFENPGAAGAAAAAAAAVVAAAAAAAWPQVLPWTPPKQPQQRLTTMKDRG